MRMIMDEWEELKVDDVPSDILTGDYEFQYREYDWGFFEMDGFWKDTTFKKTVDILERAKYIEYRYRKIGPSVPSYEELQKRIYNTLAYLNCGVVHEYKIILKLLTGRESADIPPETN